MRFLLLKTGVVMMLCVAAAGPCPAQTFYPLGTLAGSSPNFSYANGLTASGGIAVGQSGNSAFAWSPANGMVGLPVIAGTTGGRALAVSSVGSHAVGESTGTSVGSAATIWFTSGGGLSASLLYPASVYSYATGVSSDGTFVSGTVNPSVGNGAAVRWQVNYTTGTITTTQLTSAVGFNAATGVSGNGGVVVGVANDLAFRWDSGLGLSILGDLPGGSIESGSQAVSRDGSTIVGYGTTATGRKAFRWTQSSGMSNLGTLPGSTFSIANAVSANGGVVVGKSTNSGGDYVAFIWDSAHGMRDMKTVLTNEYGLGQQLQNWSLTEAYAVNDNGTTIAGWGVNPSGQTRGWVVNLTPVPEPLATVPCVFAALIIARRMRKR
jgi:probable HAF family extracellular repeat protein